MIAALDVTTGLSLLSLIVVVVLAVAAAGWAVFKASETTQSIALWQTNAAAQEKRAIEAERQLGLLQIDMAALKIRLTNAEEMASGTKAISELRVMLADQHLELMKAIGGAR